MLAAKSRFFTSVITGPQTFQYARQDIARKIILVEWKIYDYKFLAQKPVNSAFSTVSFIASFSKIIESLFVNANTANTKQLFGAETLPKFRETPGPRLEVIFPCASMPKIFIRCHDGNTGQNALFQTFSRLLHWVAYFVKCTRTFSRILSRLYPDKIQFFYQGCSMQWPIYSICIFFPNKQTPNALFAWP